MRWPHPADAAALCRLARDVFLEATKDQPFRISRVVLALQYPDGAAAAAGKRMRAEATGRDGGALQQSILRFVGTELPQMSCMQAAASPAVATAASASVSVMSAGKAQGARRGTLRDFFGPTTAAPAAADTSNKQENVSRDKRVGGDVRGAAFGNGGSCDADGKGGGAGVRDPRKRTEERRQKSESKPADVVVID